MIMTTADINEDCCGEDAATNKPAKREHEWVWCCDMCDMSYCRVCYTTWSEEDCDERCTGELK